MLKRLINVIYLFSILLAFIVPLVILVENIGSGYVRRYYQTKCDNGKYVVLQGSTSNEPWKVSILNTSDLTRDDIETASFYCQHYDEVQQYIDEYKSARSPDDERIANERWWKYRENTKFDYGVGFKIVLVRSDYSDLLYSVLTSLYIFVGMIVSIQLARIVFEYVLYGKFVLNPISHFKKILKKS